MRKVVSSGGVKAEVPVEPAVPQIVYPGICGRKAKSSDLTSQLINLVLVPWVI